MNTDIRYRDYGTFKYWFRSIEENAPWVNKIYLITEGHLPKWLNKENKKLVIVKHSDYMKSEYLPTFNSNAIELNVHRIKELSEHFVLFNDDLFLFNMTNKEDFFKNGLPRDYAVYSPIVPYREFSSIAFNNVKIINKYFNKKENLKKYFWKIFNFRYGRQNLRTLTTIPWPNFLGYWNSHVTSSFLKSTFAEVWDKEQETLNSTSLNKFRTTLDVNQWIMRHFQIEKGLYTPQKLNFGYKITLNEFEKIERAFNSKKTKVVCINDDFGVENYDIKMQKLISLFEEKYPKKSSFEL